MTAAELRSFELLAELSESEREIVGGLLEERQVSAGAPLFREGSEAEGLVLLFSGEARLAARRSAETVLIGPGSWLGATSLVVVGAREATALAVTPCRIGLLPRTAFLRLGEDAPRAACRLAEALVRELAGLVREMIPGTPDLESSGRAARR